MLLNCGVGEDSWKSLGQQEIKPVNSKGNQFWIIIGRADAEAETPILWPPDTKNWLNEKTLMLGMIESGRRRERQRTRWMASLMRWTWVWVSSGSWWWAGKPGVLQSMGSQNVGHDWVTELNCPRAHNPKPSGALKWMILTPVTPPVNLPSVNQRIMHQLITESATSSLTWV